MCRGMRKSESDLFMQTAQTPSAESPVPANALELIKLISVLGALTAFNSVSIDMYLPAFPQMAEDLHVPLGTIQLSISTFLIGTSVGQLIYGPVSDRWGRKLPLVLGVTLYSIATFACAMVHTGTALLFWRVVMALGGGASIVISRAMVRDLYTTSEAARMLSLLILVMGVAPILAPVAGGQFLLWTGWRGIFIFLAIFGILSLWGSVAWLPETLPQERRVVHRFGEMLKTYGDLMRHRSFVCYALALGMTGGLIFSYIAGAPQLFIEEHGMSPQTFGVLFGVNASGLIAASQVNRRLLKSWPATRMLGIATWCSTAVSLLLAVSVLTGLGGFLFQALLIFVCLCTTGFLFPNIMALALDPFPKSAGSASALMGAMQYSLGALAGSCVGFFHDGTARPMALTMAGCAIVATLACRLAAAEMG